MLKNYQLTQIENLKRKRENARCNCMNRERCPLNGNCLIENVISKAIVRKEYDNNDINERISTCATELNCKSWMHNYNLGFINKNMQIKPYYLNMYGR